MAVGSGQTDPVNPGGEGTSTDNPVQKDIVFATKNGLVCLLGEDYLYDGHTHKGTINGDPVFGTSPTNYARITTSGITWTTGGRYEGLWMLARTAANSDTWYLVDHVDTTNNYVYIQGETALTFHPVDGETVEFGRIQAYRDFSIMRPNGNTIRLDNVWVDHEGATGDDDGSTHALLYVETFAQGLTPDNPLVRVGTTQVDESVRNGRDSFRLNVDSTASAQSRSTRFRPRMTATVRNAQIKVNFVKFAGREWKR